MRCEGRVRNKAVGLFALRELLSDGRWHSTAELALELGGSAPAAVRRIMRRWRTDQEVGLE